MEQVITGALIGLAFGIGTSVTGLLKNKTSEEYKGINYAKAAPTIIVTGIAGAYLGTTEMPMDTIVLGNVAAALAAVGVTEWITNIGKAIWQRFKK